MANEEKRPDISGKVVVNMYGIRYRLTSKIPDKFFDKKLSVSKYLGGLYEKIAIVDNNYFCLGMEEFVKNRSVTCKIMLGRECVKYLKDIDVDLYYAQPI